MSKQLTFYFIRHGRTQWNEQGFLQGSGNSLLTEQGIAGAQKTGAALQQVEFTAAYSSILQRAIDTASHIIGQRPIPLFQHCGLNEQSFGSWEGMQIADLRKLTCRKTLRCLHHRLRMKPARPQTAYLRSNCGAASQCYRN